MAAIINPISQELFPTPNSHVNYIFDTQDTIEEYRTSRYLNRIINIFGQDCVVRGLDVSSISITDNDLIININKGVLIQDSTLITILNDFDKSINSLAPATQSNSNYIVILYTSFQFPAPDTILLANPNNFSIKIGILDSSTNKVYNGDPDSASQVSWNTNLYRTIIYATNIIDFENILSEVTIGANTYMIRSNRVGSSIFSEINSFPLFNPDGGEII